MVLVNLFASIFFGKTVREKEQPPWISYTGWELLEDYPLDLLFVVGATLAVLGVLSVWWFRGKPGLVGWRAVLTIVAYPVLFHFLTMLIALASLFYPTEFHFGVGLMLVAAIAGFLGAVIHTVALITRAHIIELFERLKAPFAWRMPR